MSVNFYLEDCQAIGRGKRYTRNLKTYIEIAYCECDWKYLLDISAIKFERWRANSELSGKTLNEYLSGLNVFLNRLYDSKMISKNPFKGCFALDLEKTTVSGREAEE